MSIVHNCMVVNVQIGIWTGHRLDKEASRHITETAGAESDAARVNKHLIPKELLKPIVSASNALRTHFYTNTLPWKDNGDRLLTRQRYMSFIEEHSRLKRDFNAAVQLFLDRDYLIAKEKAEFRMGDLFKSEDYPEPRELRHRFYVNLDIDAVTEAKDFRLDMDQEEIEKIRGHMEAAMQQRFGKAMKDVWDRLAETLGHFAAKMDGDEIFRNSTVQNLQDIVELLPDLNVLNDPDLNAVIDQIRQNLTGYDPADLRKDPVVRKAAATEANRIMAEMAGFMNAFGKAA